MSNLEPRIEAVRERYGLARDDFWQIKQNKQWVCKHAALEIVAVKAGIEWLPPQIIEANAPALVTSMIVTGRMGDRVEWAAGETNATNYSVVGKQPAYPWAMAEKRAKDRVVLKLVGIHGLVYSEDEAEDFKQESRTTDQRSEQGRREVANQQRQSSKTDEARTIYSALQADMRKCETADDLGRWWRDAECVSLREKLPADWKANLRQQCIDLGKELEAKPRDTVADIQDEFPGSRPVNERITDVSGRELENWEAA